MTRLHCIPAELRSFLEPLRKEFSYNHYLTFLWLVLAIMNNSKKGTLKNLSQIPAKKSYHTFLRFLKARYLQPRRWLMFTALARLKALRGKETELKIVSDVTWIHKTGQHDWISRGYKSNAKPEQGLQLLVLCFEMQGQRIPFDFFIISKPDGHRLSYNPQMLKMMAQLKLPKWVKSVVLLADAAFASKRVIQKLNQWGWGYVFRLPKTWKFEQGGLVKEHLEKLPRKAFKLCWYASAHGKRKYCQYFKHRARLSHVGDVTLIYSFIKGKLEPEKRILVTNRPLNHSKILALYQRRWCIEILFKELKSEMGLGKMQLSVARNQVMTAIGVVMVAYNTLFSVFKNPAGGIAKLKSTFQMKCIRQNLFSFASRYLSEPVLERFMLQFAS